MVKPVQVTMLLTGVTVLQTTCALLMTKTPEQVAVEASVQLAKVTFVQVSTNHVSTAASMALVFA